MAVEQAHPGAGTLRTIPSSGRSMMKQAASPLAPIYFNSLQAASAVPPVAMRSSTRMTRSNCHGVTPNRLARSAGVMSVGFRSNRMPASCSALATSETQP
jgi:hypothetical protein